MYNEHEAQKRIPTILSSIRSEAGFSQEELSALLGISRSTLRRYELGQGDPPPLRVSIPWCRACGYPPKKYIERVYGITISDTSLDEDRQAIIRFARTAPPDQISAVSSVTRALEEKNGKA